MATIYHRIKQLCERRNTTIAEVERTLGLANCSLQRWGTKAMPSADRLARVASYFGVTTDYLLGNTDIAASASTVLRDADIIMLQRARERMIPSDREKMMQLLKISFDYAFADENKDKR